MADQQPAKAYVVAMTFGMGEGQQIIAQAVLAPHPAAAAALAVSAAHIHAQVTQGCTGIAVEEMLPDFIERARRGFVGDAPVVSLVPQPTNLPGSEPVGLGDTGTQGAPQGYAERLKNIWNPPAPDDGTA